MNTVKTEKLNSLEPVSTGLAYIVLPVFLVYGIINEGLPLLTMLALLYLSVAPYIIFVGSNGKRLSLLSSLLYCIALTFSLSAVKSSVGLTILMSVLVLSILAFILSSEKMVAFSLTLLIVGTLLSKMAPLPSVIAVSLGLSVLYAGIGKLHASIATFFTSFIAGIYGGATTLYMVAISLYMFSVTYFLAKDARCPFRREPELTGAGLIIALTGVLFTVVNQALGYLVWSVGILVVTAGLLSPAWFEKKIDGRI